MDTHVLLLAHVLLGWCVQNLLNVLASTQAVEALLVHVMDECEACETEGCRSCSICHAGDRIYPFQVFVRTSAYSLCNAAKLENKPISEVYAIMVALL